MLDRQYHGNADRLRRFWSRRCIQQPKRHHDIRWFRLCGESRKQYGDTVQDRIRWGVLKLHRLGCQRFEWSDQYRYSVVERAAWTIAIHLDFDKPCICEIRWNYLVKCVTTNL